MISTKKKNNFLVSISINITYIYFKNEIYIFKNYDDNNLNFLYYYLFLIKQIYSLKKKIVSINDFMIGTLKIYYITLIFYQFLSVNNKYTTFYLFIHFIN